VYKRQTQDYGKAEELYRKAASQEYVSAQYNLGVMYERGHGIHYRTLFKTGIAKT
jgi:TPR repeat protein